MCKTKLSSRLQSDVLLFYSVGKQGNKEKKSKLNDHKKKIKKKKKEKRKKNSRTNICERQLHLQTTREHFTAVSYKPVYPPLNAFAPSRLLINIFIQMLKIYRLDMPTASRCNRHLSRTDNETPTDFSFSTCYVIIKLNKVKFFFCFFFRSTYFAVFFKSISASLLFARELSKEKRKGRREARACQYYARNIILG